MATLTVLHQLDMTKVGAEVVGTDVLLGASFEIFRLASAVLAHPGENL